MPEKPEDLKTQYKTVMDDHFPRYMRISFGNDLSGKMQDLIYEKVTWIVDDPDKGPVKKGLRYGDNPPQESVIYRLVNGNLVLGNVRHIEPGNGLVTDFTMEQAGKHPGRINLTDTDNALNMLRHFRGKPTAVFVKHNNPCGVGRRGTLPEAFEAGYLADRLAAFGGVVAVNMPLDIETAELITKDKSRYFEVVAAPEFEDGTLKILSKKKNLRVLRIDNMKRLQDYIGQRFIDFKSLMDGGQCVQWSYVPTPSMKWKKAETEFKDKTYVIKREPTPDEMVDLDFGWLVESGITSNSIIYVKDETTIGIGTGEQDRVGVAEAARDKAYRKMADRICFEKYGVKYNDLLQKAGLKQHLPSQITPIDLKSVRDYEAVGRLVEIDDEVTACNGGLLGARMISDAFFPFRDGVDVGIAEGITAVAHAGGSERDFESIVACNEAEPPVAMIFTGERSFKH
ncbi:MAG: IMP cyclohydrolase [Candidatus Aenigmarchaeota archaeon]